MFVYLKDQLSGKINFPDLPKDEMKAKAKPSIFGAARYKSKKIHGSEIHKALSTGSSIKKGGEMDLTSMDWTAVQANVRFSERHSATSLKRNSPSKTMMIYAEHVRT